MQIDEIDPVQALAQKIRRHIDRAENDDLVTTLQAAEKYLSDQKGLMFDAFFTAGNYRLKEQDTFSSILYFNKARKYNPATITVFDKIVESLVSFYTQNKDKAIKTDLLELIPPIRGINDYYQTIAPENESSQKAENLLRSIAYRLEFVAPDGIESPITYRVNQIRAALEKDVPMEQVKLEVAKYIAELLKKKRLTKSTNHKSNRTKE